MRTRAAAGLVLLLGLGPAAGGDAPVPGTVALSPLTFDAGGRTLAAQDGMLFVLENRSKPHSRTIGVHFIRIPGTRRQAPPIVLLPDGPGRFVVRFPD